VLIRGRQVLLGALFVAAMAACGQTPTSESPAQELGTATSASETAPPYDEGPPIDWDNMIAGAPVNGLSSIPKTAFTVHEPKDLGVPVGTFTGATDPTSGKLGAVQFVYDTFQYGRVVVIEHVSDLPDAKEYAAYMASMASLSGQPGTYGTAEIVTFADGSQGLYETSPDGSYASIYWYVESGTGNYEIMIFGPKITKADAVAIADGF
jgi:hypothetical protein